MYKIFGTASYRTNAEAVIKKWLEVVPRTPGQLVYLNDWGSLRHASNAVFI